MTFIHGIGLQEADFIDNIYQLNGLVCRNYVDFGFFMQSLFLATQLLYFKYWNTDLLQHCTTMDEAGSTNKIETAHSFRKPEFHIRVTTNNITQLPMPDIFVCW
ncbi:Uncharacterised protein [Klebsiella pneumoniae]|nr:Uncharacterised protein [Klebsiella pneumoniae]